MSLRTLPLLFINLGGEMMYILDQRLRAQNIPPDKAKKVLHDIVGTMFNRRFMDELFKPQEAYSKKAMRTVFDRLAHASIMRLNSASMDKLYDLMTMAFKYQVSLCLRPSDIMLVTLNHMDAMRTFVEEAPAIKAQVDNVFRLLITNYSELSQGEFHLIRQTLLGFFQDMHIRVSIFLKDKVQNTNGRFVLPCSGPLPFGAEIPGTIRLYNADGNMSKSVNFPSGGTYSGPVKEGSTEIRGDRVTKLGTNMYSLSRPVEASLPTSKVTAAPSDLESNNPDPVAKAELNLLAHLMGGIKETKAGQKSEFRLNLFSTDEEEEQAAAMRPPDESYNVVNIDASKKQQSEELSKIMGDFHIESSDANADDDLLELMDSAY
ncbi:protein OSCP1-like [Branchiostoma lanceolatum]|uniref:protein OSCP1-like n=1 Tax=Branchiostoma lanceolatum TaxID=7740 RepID=UPI00345195BC